MRWEKRVKLLIKSFVPFPVKICLFAFAVLALQGCNRSFHDVGAPPELTSVDYEVPIEQVIVAPEPAVLRGPQRVAMADNSIWNKHEVGYFRDTRAFQVGDILTVDISIDDSARLNNTSGRESSLTGSLDAGGSITLPVFGKLPELTSDASLGAGLELERGGSVNRNERINLQVAAAVVESSENGNLHIIGSQEVRVNHELRILTVEGFVRAKDIRPDNTIPYERMAEARITYGGHNSRRRPVPVKDWKIFRPFRQATYDEVPGEYEQTAVIYK
jgi:flagellar L-ring protein precursor FlgH